MTNTEVGQAWIAESVERWSRMGSVVSPSDVNVFNIGSQQEPDILIVPTVMKWKVVESIQGERTSCEADCSPRAIQIEIPTISSEFLESFPRTSLATWSQIQQNCFVRADWKNSLGIKTRYADMCYKQHKLLQDNDNSYDYWEYEVYGTFGTYPGFRMWSMTADIVPAQNTPTLYWKDWSPKSDTTLSTCNSVTLSVTGGKSGAEASLSLQRNFCETMDMTKYSTPGRLRNTWRTDNSVLGTSGDREMGLMVSVSVAQNQTPQLLLVLP